MRRSRQDGPGDSHLESARAAPSLRLPHITNAAVLALNAEARRARRSEGKLGADKRIQAWEDRFDAPRRKFALKLAVGDQLMFTKNDKRLGVKNGTIGTLVALEKGFAFVQLGGKKGPVIPVNLSESSHHRHPKDGNMTSLVASPYAGRGQGSALGWR